MRTDITNQLQFKRSRDRRQPRQAVGQNLSEIFNFYVKWKLGCFTNTLWVAYPSPKTGSAGAMPRECCSLKTTGAGTKTLDTAPARGTVAPHPSSGRSSVSRSHSRSERQHKRAPTPRRDAPPRHAMRDRTEGGMEECGMERAI